MVAHKNPSKIFRRPCRRCEKMYQPDGKFQRYCEPCQKKAKAEKTVKMKEVINER